MPLRRLSDPGGRFMPLTKLFYGSMDATLLMGLYLTCADFSA